MALRFSYRVVPIYEAEINQCGLISGRHCLNFCRSEEPLAISR
jgi:hypothetical protein